MHFRTLAAALAAAATITLANPAPSLAQMSGGGSVVSVDSKLISVEFKGGSLADFIAQLREAAGGMPVNILYPPEFAGLQLPPMQLEQVLLDSALRVASTLSESRPAMMPDGRKASWEVDRQGGGPGAPVYVIHVWAEELDESPEVVPDKKQQPRFTAVHSITELTTGSGRMSADDVLSAIQAALAIEGEGGDTEIRFHEQTGLVFARVTPSQGSVIEQTLDNLDRSMRARQHGESQSEIESIYKATGTSSTAEVIMRVRAADDMRTRVLELQRTIAELQTHIINLEAELARRDKAKREGGN